MTLTQARDQIEMFYGSPLTVMSDCLRGFLEAAPGHLLIASDFASIESRVLGWLAGEEKKLIIFRTHGLAYEAAASDIYRVPIEKVSKAQRQIGKVAELALGFQGGKLAFKLMAEQYGIKVTDDEADIIKTNWRHAHPNIVRFWHDLEKQARLSLLNPGKIQTLQTKYTQIKFVVKGSFMFIQLPSGRALSYPYPKLEMVKTPWGEQKEQFTYMSEDSTTRKWERQKAYGGLLCENITQAVARDLLAEAMLRIDEAKLPIVLHVHDEIVCEVPKGTAQMAQTKMDQLMEVVPTWAKGLPIKAESWIGRRYRK